MRNPEVRDHGYTIGRHQDIGRLDVSVDNAAVMCMFQSQSNLNRNRCSYTPIQTPALCNLLFQAVSFNILLGDVAHALIFPNTIHTDDIRV